MTVIIILQVNWCYMYKQASVQMLRYKLAVVLFGQGTFMFFSHELSKVGTLIFCSTLYENQS